MAADARRTIDRQLANRALVGRFMGRVGISRGVLQLRREMLDLREGRATPGAVQLRRCFDLDGFSGCPKHRWVGAERRLVRTSKTGLQSCEIRHFEQRSRSTMICAWTTTKSNGAPEFYAQCAQQMLTAKL